MNCKKCGSIIPNGVNVCPNCKEPVESQILNNGQVLNNQMVSPNISTPVSDNLKAQSSHSNKKSKVKMIVIIICLLLVITLICLVGFNVVKNNKRELEDKKIASEVKPDNSAEQVVNVKFGDYSFQVPSLYKAEVINSLDNSQYLNLVSDNDQTLTIAYDEADYNKAKTNSYITTKYKNALNVKIQLIEGLELITGEVNQNGKNMVVGIAYLEENKVYILTATNKDNTIDYELFKELVKIIKTAKTTKV